MLSTLSYQAAPPPRRERRHCFVVRRTSQEDRTHIADLLREVDEREKSPKFCGRYWHNGRFYSRREYDAVQMARERSLGGIQVDDNDDDNI